MMSREQVRHPEPELKRRACSVHHRSRGHRRLRSAALALPHAPRAVHAPNLLAAVLPAAEPVRPAAHEQVVATRLLGREPLLELHDRQREAGTRHPVKLRTRPDGTKPVCTCYECHRAAPTNWTTAFAVWPAPVARSQRRQCDRDSRECGVRSSLRGRRQGGRGLFPPRGCSMSARAGLGRAEVSQPRDHPFS